MAFPFLEIAKNLFIHVQRKKIELIYDIALDIPDILWGDPCRLRQILTNLIGNAIKFTEKGSVTLAVESHEQNEQEVALRFSIQDTGIGVSKESLDKLFKPFSQTHAALERNLGGTGLGLAICKEIIELHQGEIWVESTLGEGSIFSFALPIKAIKL